MIPLFYWVRSSGNVGKMMGGQDNMHRRLGKQNCLGQKGAIRIVQYRTVVLPLMVDYEIPAEEIREHILLPHKVGH